MPDGRHVATASQDNIRLWNTYEYFHDDKLAAGGEGMKKRGGLPPFKIIAGHHGGIVSSMREWRCIPLDARIRVGYHADARCW
jgi:transcriptional activator SPT8